MSSDQSSATQIDDKNITWQRLAALPAIGILLAWSSSSRLVIAFLAAWLIAACSQQSAATKRATAANAATQAAPIVPTADGAFSPQIKAEDFAAYNKRLACDEFGGRKPAIDGERLTTQFLVDEFERMGLQPGNKEVICRPCRWVRPAWSIHSS